ncbi:MAG: GNAT family N-acetyltransferase [Pseudonocardia sp.]|nr:GNAT family N-acetyltransferase [Pseudonocardia sp.]
MLPATLQMRPMTPDDAAGWAALLAVCEEADGRGEHYDVEDCAEELAEPGLDLTADTWFVLDDDHPVGYQILHLRPGAQRWALSEAAVHPAHRGRGVGSALLARAREWAAQRGAGFVLQVPETQVDAVELAVGAGLTAVRWWSELRRDLARPVVPAALPDGLTVAPLGPPYEAARWDEPLRAAHNAAFAGHWGSSPVPADTWAHLRGGNRNFRPACSAAALTGAGAVAGYLLAYEFDADTARTGVRDLYVATVGTVDEWRGRGVAGALLAHVLTVAAADGFGRSSLTVDTQNPTGALGVYDRAGYVVHRREVSYTDA